MDGCHLQVQRIVVANKRLETFIYMNRLDAFRSKQDQQEGDDRVRYAQNGSRWPSRADGGCSFRAVTHLFSLSSCAKQKSKRLHFAIAAVNRGKLRNNKYIHTQ